MRHKERSYKKNSAWLFPLSVGIMLTASVGIYITARLTLREPIAEQAGTAQSSGLVDHLTPGPLQMQVDPNAVTRDFELGTAPDVPGYSRHDFEARVGDVIRLRFTNNSEPRLHYQHDFVLIKPSAVRSGLKRFMPVSSDVLAHTEMLGPGETDTIVFRAPEEPGDYPFICSFPGHSNIEKGTLHIRK